MIPHMALLEDVLDGLSDDGLQSSAMFRPKFAHNFVARQRVCESKRSSSSFHNRPVRLNQRDIFLQALPFLQFGYELNGIQGTDILLWLPKNHFNRSPTATSHLLIDFEQRVDVVPLVFAKLHCRRLSPESSLDEDRRRSLVQVALFDHAESTHGFNKTA